MTECSRLTQTDQQDHRGTGRQRCNAITMWKSLFAWPWYGTFFLGLVAHAVSAVPGCSSDFPAIFSKLCDTDAGWGIVVEAIAALGIVICFVLVFVVIGSITFITDARKRSVVAVLAIFVLGTLGLYGLTFAFIVGPNEGTCPTRRFLFGVLFAICFACLLAHCYALIKGEVPSASCVFLIMLGLAMVQVIIDTQWLITTIVSDDVDSCMYQPKDFVMALIYVMVLMAVTLILALLVLCRHRRDEELIFSTALILTVTIFSIAIWITWITLYVRGIDDLKHRPQWDDPVLAIALVVNATVFLLFYIIPMVAHLTREGTSDVGNYQVTKDSLVSVPKAFMVENKAFSPEEAASHFQPSRTYDNPHLFHPTPAVQMINGKNTDHLIPRPSYHPHPSLYADTAN
uniref:G-protein coupled receptor family C group 5 member C-like isoform X1 n=1 Tax=Myxine glutinosa TaxID=7769 RepID=UPI00358DF890